MIHDEIPLFILDNNTDYCFYPRMWTYMPKLMEKSCPLPFPQMMPSIRLVSAHYCETLHGYFQQNRSPNITINEKMIFEIRPTITLPLQSSLTMSVVWWWQRDLAKSLLHVQSFCCSLDNAFLFSRFLHRHYVCLSSLVALPCKRIRIDFIAKLKIW